MVASPPPPYSFDVYHALGTASDAAGTCDESRIHFPGITMIRTFATLNGQTRATGTDPRTRTGPTATAFRSIGLVAALVGLAACGNTATTAAGNGTLAVQLTDAPFTVDSVRSVDIYVVRVDGRMADADSSAAAKGASDDSAATGGWTTLAAPNQSVNLLAFQGGLALPLGGARVPAGNYLGFRLVIDPTKSSLTLKNGIVLNGTSTPSITFPSAARSGIKIVLAQPASVVANQTTTVLIDFMVGNSFVMRGNSMALNGLLFTPVIHATVK